jgi:hypothetical protein
MIGPDAVSNGFHVSHMHFAHSDLHAFPSFPRAVQIDVLQLIAFSRVSLPHTI